MSYYSDPSLEVASLRKHIERIERLERRVERASDFLIREALEDQYNLSTMFLPITCRYSVFGKACAPDTNGYGPTPITATKDWAAKNGVAWEIPQ